jgi:hypothetical protein
MKKVAAQLKLDPVKIYMNAERFRLADNYLRSSGELHPDLMNVVGIPVYRALSYVHLQ